MFANAARRPERLERSAHEALNRPKRSVATYLRPRLIRGAAKEARHIFEVERAGESEWTPWIAIAGLMVFYAAIGLLMFGIIEVASHLLTSAYS